MRSHLIELGQRLEDADPRVREAAARALAEAHDASGAPLLRGALEDVDAGVRTWASQGLARLGLPGDTGLLRCALMDEEPRVRLWAAFGLAGAGDRTAPAQLVGFLEEGPSEVRRDAAQALVALAPSGALTRLLVQRLETGADAVRTWCAAVLAGRGSSGALALWRRALRAPDTRVDAALAAPFLRSSLAARDLVEVAARLPREALQAPAGGAGSLAELLTTPLLTLGLAALQEDAEDEPELRHALYLLLIRAPDAPGPVREGLLGVLRALAPAEVGHELAALLQTLPQRERPPALAALSRGLPDAVVAAFHALPVPLREALAQSLAHESSLPLEASARLGALLAPAVGAAGVDPAPPDSPVRRGSSPGPHGAAARARTEGRALASGHGVEPEGDGSQGHSRPRATLRRLPAVHEVAARASVLETLLARAQLEVRFAPRRGPDAAARRAAQQLRARLEEAGLLGTLEPIEADLLELSPGGWDAEDHAYARACGEALAQLWWALGGPEHPAEAAPLDAAALLARAEARPAERGPLRPRAQLREARARCEAWQLRAEQEALAREVLAGRAPDTLDVSGLLEEVAAAGFDGTLLERRCGHAAVVAEALRFAGRCVAARLLEEGRLGALVDGDLPFGGLAFAALGDDALARAREVLRARTAALAWLTLGGPWMLEGSAG